LPAGAARAVAVTLGAAVLAVVLLDRLAPAPTADVSRGSEDPFVSGLFVRELAPRQPPRRWTSGRVVATFEHLSPGPAALTVAIHGQRGPVVVAAGGVVVGTLGPGTSAAEFPLMAVGRRLEVELRVPEFVASPGRRLGAQLDRVSLTPSPPAVPAPGLVLAVVAPALVVVLLALWLQAPPLAALGLALAITLLQCLALWPCGLLRSSYSGTLAVDIVAGALGAAAFAAMVGAQHPARRPWAFAAALAAVVVQGLAAVSPVMLASDVVFHANKLMAVAGGDLFPTSVTQHAEPFRIPYGVSFYALLSPFARYGWNPVSLVRVGAALAGVVASMALFAMLVRYRPAAEAALAVILLQLLPGTFDIYSYGNLSNAFGQAVTVVFFAWWVGGAPGGTGAGAALLALGCLAHLSCFLVLLALCGALLLVEWRELKSDRVRLLALGLGFLLSLAYYAHFVGLIAEQAPRLLEGGGQGRGASRSSLDALRLQVLGLRTQWGLPVILLAAAALRRPRTTALDRGVLAFWLAGALLFVPAVVSPLDVRYLYALTLPLAISAAAGVFELMALGIPAVVAAWALVAWQAWLGWSEIVEAVLRRYR
jgi:hypothetical protein